MKSVVIFLGHLESRLFLVSTAIIAMAVER